MDEIVLLTSLAMFLLLAAVCSIIFNRIKLPPLIGYLISGIIVANVMEITEEQETVVSILADMGLIMLMFCIGMEINLKKLRKQGVFAMKVALIEVPFMVLGGTVVGMVLGMGAIPSICLGGVIAGSSTAVVLGVLNMQNRLSREEVDTLILVIIMEDISQVIILSMLTPLMAGSELDGGGIAAMVVSILAFMIVAVVAGLKLMPRIINWISDNVSPEILTVTTVGLAFGMALLASYVGLSVAIGAFLMGMMVAPGRKSKDILHDIEPMKNIFMAMFFISVGMEIALGTLMENIVLTLVFLIMFISLKTVAVFLGYWMSNEKARKSFECAVSYLAMGEFAFIIAKQAFDYDVFTEGMYTAIVGAALASMILLPLISKNAATGWDRTLQHTPKRALRLLMHIDSIKSAFYFRISQTSKKTRKEIASSMTLSYFLVLIIAFIEIVFVLISPYFMEWGEKYFGGGSELWAALVLLINLFIISIPIHKLIRNLRVISVITRRNSPKLPFSNERSAILEIINQTNTSILTLIIGISIIIVVPNGIELWEHFVVLFIALAFLLVYNHTMVGRRIAAQDLEDAQDEDMDLDKFKALIDEKVRENEAQAGIERSASIDTGDKRY